MAVDYPELAARLLGATIATDVADFRLLPIDHDDYDRLAEAALRVLGATRFDAAWTLGQELEFEQVVEAAVSILEKVVAAHDELPEL
jgi:hypothetical protein